MSSIPIGATRPNRMRPTAPAL